MLSDNDKYQMKIMSEKNNVVDQTDKIRELKHSAEIRTCIIALLRLKNDHAELLKTNKPEFEKLALAECGFLFHNYMELYNIMLKGDMTPDVLFNLLDVLEQIELGKCNQYEGSVKVGSLLKEIYIDHKLAETARLDEKYAKTPKQTGKNINWAEYKSLGNV